MTFLFDSNLLIALCFPEHDHHTFALSWLQANPSFAICPISEGALARFIVRSYPDGAQRIVPTLQALARRPGYHFLPADASYESVAWNLIQGHRQVTDAYLVSLAAKHGAQLATFDRALAALHPQAVLVPQV